MASQPLTASQKSLLARLVSLAQNQMLESDRVMRAPVPEEGGDATGKVVTRKGEYTFLMSDFDALCQSTPALVEFRHERFKVTPEGFAANIQEIETHSPARNESRGLYFMAAGLLVILLIAAAAYLAIPQVRNWVNQVTVKEPSVASTEYALANPSFTPRPTVPTDTPTPNPNISATPSQTPTLTPSPTETLTATPLPTLTPQPTPGVIPAVAGCLPNTWGYWEYPQAHPTTTPTPLAGQSNCWDLSAAGFSFQKNASGAPVLHINASVDAASNMPLERYIFAPLGTADGEINLTVDIQKLESQQPCVSGWCGNGDVDLVIGIGQYPTAGQGRFLIYRVAGINANEWVCTDLVIGSVCDASQPGTRIDTIIPPAKFQPHEISIIRNGSTVIFYYQGKRIGDIPNLLKSDKFFWIGYDIHTTGAVQADITWR